MLTLRWNFKTIFVGKGNFRDTNIVCTLSKTRLPNKEIIGQTFVYRRENCHMAQHLCPQPLTTQQGTTTTTMTVCRPLPPPSRPSSAIATNRSSPPDPPVLTSPTTSNNRGSGSGSDIGTGNNNHPNNADGSGIHGSAGTQGGIEVTEVKRVFVADSFSLMLCFLA